MINKLVKIGLNIIYKHTKVTPEKLREKGAIVGENVNIHGGKIDVEHAFLLEIGSNVIISDARILMHDGSTKLLLGYSTVGRVTIGSNVFIGADSVVMPGVTIGSNVIIGASTVVNSDVPDNSVFVGNPGRVVESYDDFAKKKKDLFLKSPHYETYHQYKSVEEKKQMHDELDGRLGFDV